MRGFFRDLRFAARRLSNAPGFTIAVLLTLAIGIGGNAAIFSFVNGILLRPLPYPRSDRLVMVCETNPERMSDWCGASPANASDWASGSRTIQSIGLARTWPFGWKTQGRLRGVSGGIATPGVFEALGVAPAMGRLFEPGDLHRGSEHVALVSDAFWRERLGQQEVIGQRLELDRDSYEIVGVLPRGFDLPLAEGVEVWIPLWPERQDRRDWRGFFSIGRLAEGSTLQQARTELATLRDHLAADHPDTNAAWGIAVDSLHERLTRPVRRSLLVFTAAVGLVLLIACANVANLMLARALARQKDDAVRLALGAGRAHLVRAMICESLILSAGGGLLGLLLALWAIDLLVGLAPGWFPRLDGVAVTVPVAALTAMLSLVTGLACGLVPALSAGSASLMDSLRDGRASGERGRGSRTRSLLVLAETALAVLLLIGSGLLIRSFGKLLDWSPGFDRDRLTVVQMFVSSGRYPKTAQVLDAFNRVEDEVRSLPSVVSVGSGSAVPLWGGDGEDEFLVEGRPDPGAGRRPSVAWFDADPGYFATLRLPMVRGRAFTPEDRIGSMPVAIINETMAARHWPGEDPIGKRVRLSMQPGSLTIVGVVADVRPFRPDEPTKSQIYWPFAQSPRWAVQLVIRTAGDPAGAAAAIRARIEQTDPDVEIGRFRTMDELVDGELTSPRFAAILSLIFGIIALATAVVGVYGVMSFSVARRTREIGIRMAMGAGRGRILGQVLGRGLWLVVCGEVVGLAGALALTRLLGRMLVDLAPTDAATFAVMPAVLLIVALAACYLPARRATRVDPMVVLRSE